MPARRRVWITYAWVDDREGDFQFLVQELLDAGVDATYDRIALVPGQDLWQQIGTTITEAKLDGWAYLVTPSSIESQACREELAYALNRALQTKGRDFPLLALVHGVRIIDLPPALRIRLCVSLADPAWREQVRAALERRPPIATPNPQSRYNWRVHYSFQNQADLVAVEVRPRFGEVMFWRLGVPMGADRVTWGSGPAGGKGPSGVSFSALIDAKGIVQGSEVLWFGAADRLSPSVSAYVVFRGALPRFIAFGVADSALGLPTEAEVFYPAV
jgi:hypothetical protein